MRITDIITEGYTIMPSIDPKYTVMPDMEGPFQLRNGKVVYYDPKQGQYYDRDTDQYISYEDYREMDAPTAQSNKMNQLQGKIDMLERMIKRTNNAAKKQQLTVELQALLSDSKVNENVGAHSVKKAVSTETRSPIKAAHFRKMADDIRSSILQDESPRADVKTQEAADVSTTGYQWAHGKKPSGQGSWFFTVHRRGVDFAQDQEGKDYIQLNMMTFSDAKRAARTWAKQQGHSQIFVAENAQHIDEVAYELGLEDHEPRVVKGVHGLKNSNFTKKFPNRAAQERWMDQNPNYEVHQVQRESATSSKHKNQSETQVTSWGSSKVIHAAAGDQAHSMMLSLQNQNDLAKLSDGDYTKITDELGEPLTVSRKNQQFTLSTADGRLSVTVDASDIISLYAR